MKKIYENGIEYILIGDYYLPSIVVPHRERHKQSEFDSLSDMIDN